MILITPLTSPAPPVSSPLHPTMRSASCAVPTRNACVFISNGESMCPAGRSEGGALMSEERDTTVEWMDGFDRNVYISDCRVIVGVLVGACSDKRTSGASSMRTIFCERGAEEGSGESEVIASSIIVRVCKMSVDLSLKTLVGAGCAVCAGTGLDIGAASAVAGPLAKPGGCLRAIGLRPGIVVLEGGASRTGDGCEFEAGGSTE